MASVYSSLARFLVQLEQAQAWTNGAKFYPVMADPANKGLRVVFSLQDDEPQVAHYAGFKTGVIQVQFDFYGSNLEEVDSLVESFKNYFIGQSRDLGAGVEITIAEAINEVDEFDLPTRTYIRSLDVRARYIKEN